MKNDEYNALTWLPWPQLCSCKPALLGTESSCQAEFGLFPVLSSFPLVLGVAICWRTKDNQHGLYKVLPNLVLLGLFRGRGCLTLVLQWVQ